MNDEHKTKDELISELTAMRQRIAKLEGALVAVKQQQEGTCAVGTIEETTDRKVAREAQAESKKRLERILSSNPAVIYAAKPDGDFGTTFISENVTAQLGYEPREFLDDSSFWPSHIHPDDVQRVLAGLSPLFEQGHHVHEYRFRHKDGSYRWMRDELNLIRDEHGTPVEITGFWMDITERRQIEEELRIRDKAIKASITGISFATPDGMISFGNDAWLRMWGFDGPDEAVGLHISELVRDKDVFSKQFATLREKGYLLDEIQARRKDGTIFDVQFSASSVLDDSGKPVCIMASFFDITDRKKAERALAESEERLELALRGADLGLWDWDLRTGKATRDERTAAIYGYPLAEIETSFAMWESLIHPDDKPEVLDKFNKHLEGSTPFYDAEYRLITKSGETKWVLARGKVSERDRDGKPLRVAGTLLDILDRKQAEEALRKAHDELELTVRERTAELSRANEQLAWKEALLSQMFNSSPLAYFVVDNRTDEILNFNHRFCEIWGIEHLADQMEQKALKNNDIIPDCIPLVKDVQAFAASCKPLQSETDRSIVEDEIEFNDGRTIRRFSTQLRDDADRYFGRFYIFEDVTERKRLEQLQRQTARYKAVADLAGGVAHNFNNLLHIVLGHLELALVDLEAGNYAEVREGLEKVLKSSRFGAEVVRRLQRFAQPLWIRASATGVFDLSDLAEQAAAVSQSSVTAAEKEGRKVSVYTRLKQGCFINANKNEIFEVVFNLVRNAVEALPAGGDIDLTTSVEGDKVVLQVRDTGVGMSPENLGRLFNPFFTTKAEPGAGLSLAAARKILEDCGGEILVDSVEGNGSTFTVWFPLAEKPPEPRKAKPVGEIERPLTILAIDDMEAITDLMKSALTARGHAVLKALSGEEGIAIFKENLADVVICDLGMPGMNGWEVGKRIRAICQERGVPETPFILLTAWAGQETETEKITESGVDAVIAKPLNLKNMYEVVREVVAKTMARKSEG